MGEIVEKYFLVLLVLTQSLAESTVRENTGRDEDHLCLGGWLLMIFLDVSQQSSHQNCRLFPVEILVLPDVDEVAEVGSHEVEGVPGLILEAGPGALLR